MKKNDKKVTLEVSLFEYATKNGIKTVGELYRLIDRKKVRTIGINTSGHNYPKTFNTRNLATQYGLNSPINSRSLLNLYDGNYNCYITEVCLDIQKRQDVIDEIVQLDKMKAVLVQKVAVLDELGLDEFDEKIINVVAALERLKKSKNKDKLAEAREFIETIEG